MSSPNISSTNPPAGVPVEVYIATAFGSICASLIVYLIGQKFYHYLKDRSEVKIEVELHGVKASGHPAGVSEYLGVARRRDLESAIAKIARGESFSEFRRGNFMARTRAIFARSKLEGGDQQEGGEPHAWEEEELYENPWRFHLKDGQPSGSNSR